MYGSSILYTYYVIHYKKLSCLDIILHLLPPIKNTLESVTVCLLCGWHTNLSGAKLFSPQTTGRTLFLNSGQEILPKTNLLLGCQEHLLLALKFSIFKPTFLTLSKQNGVFSSDIYIESNMLNCDLLAFMQILHMLFSCICNKIYLGIYRKR